MTKEEIITRLLQHRAELEAYGVEHLSLFGSVARDEATADSDIDVVVKLEDAIMQSGLGYVGALMDLKERLEDITGKSVDIVSEPLRKERFRQNVERDRVVAF
ncbi:nucleotidyltransferase domain-containing protein [Rhizobium sp. 32-5/1]|uniref:nucleotidyltransferase family protein n=1 Tax=Rhizobium sp. 32-5/1 TaxID=3019602 RepID=UPI00240D5A20|nr:nucleotidyltransferase domain-containing protein [Rhizobium sp. 32-5/1]WEZ84174.1 nucleotidyltransferase domain-containing protein [Rhizobium sp. 32-5/1]